MQKFYNNPVWNRKLRSLGTFALSAAFCFAGLLVLSSCDDDDDEVEPIEMRGFYTSVDRDGNPDCQSERVQIFSEGEGIAERESNVTLVARAGEDFEGAYFPQIGVQVGKTGNHPATIVSIYVSQTGEVLDRPGSYFLAARIDKEIAEEMIYTGYWSGYAYRPGGEGALKPAVVCPYVLVPASTDVSDNVEDGECGADQDSVDTVLEKYLEKGDGTLKACHILLAPDGNGILSLP